MRDPAAAPLRVFILDDHELVRRGFVGILQDSPGFDVVGEAATRLEALELIPMCNPDVAVIDVWLPDASGFDVCRELAALCPEVRTLVMSAYDHDDAREAALDAGARGYLAKDTSGDDFRAALLIIGHGGALADRHGRP